MTAPPFDAFTVLTTKGPLATKRIVAIENGPPKIEPYGKAQRFSFTKWNVSSFDDMAAALKASRSIRWPPSRCTQRFLLRPGSPLIIGSKQHGASDRDVR